MAIIEQERPARTAAAKTMRAAVVEDFARPLVGSGVTEVAVGDGVAMPWLGGFEGVRPRLRCRWRLSSWCAG